MEDWKSIDRQWRPAPFWSWNDKLQEGELRRQIREMAAKGWGGYFMHSRVGLVTGYLSEDWMSLVKACADEAKATNTWAWLYDEDKWPSGFAGGAVPEADPAFRVRWLVLRKAGEVPQEDEVLMEATDGDVRYAICRRVSPLDSLWFNGTSYVDLMNPKAVEYFIESTHEQYKQAVGEYLGKEIPGIFTDEPAYTYPISEPFVPWSDYLPGYFRSLNGYDIMDRVDQLFFERGDYRRTRFDFYDAATRLFRDSFTKQYYKWCCDNGLLMTGHFMAEDTLQSQTTWIGAAMPHYAHMHWPGIDKLGRHLEQIVTCKQLSSAVEQLDKERAFCEVFGCIGQHSSFLERKWIADWEAVLGIGYVNHHLSLYSMRGERKRDYPANLFYQQPWWSDERGFADYIARLSKAATEGKRDVDVLIIHPISSFWAEYSPLHVKARNMPESALYDQPFQTLSRRLMEEKLDYHYGDEILIEENGSVDHGQFRIGQHSYRVVVVPPSLTLRSNTWELLGQFAQAGGHLVFVRPTPSLSDAAQDAPNLPPSAVVVDSIEAAVSTLDGLCKQRVRVRDLVTGRECRPAFLCVRDIDDSRRILMANTDNHRELRVEVSIPLATSEGQSMKAPEIVAIDLVDGSSHPIRFDSRDDNAVVAMRMAPAGSALLVLSEAACECSCSCSCPSEECAPPASVPSASPCAQPSPVASAAPLVLGSGAMLGEEPQQVVLADSTRFDVEVLDENVMPLEKVTLWLDGKQVLTNAPIAQAWHSYFYAAPEGTPFTAEYAFDIRSVPAEGVTAVIEVAENLDRILVNGTPVTSLKRKGESQPFNPLTSWKDVNFTRVPVPVTALRKGMNTLTIEGKKSNNITGAGCHRRLDDHREHTPTEVEVVYIVGDFVVGSFDDRDFHICAVDSPCKACMQREINPTELTRTGYPFYAGRIRLSTVLNVPYAPAASASASPSGSVNTACIGGCAASGAGSANERIFLSVGSVHAASIVAYVNGEPVGTLYWSPHSIDVTRLLKPGDNRVELVAATTLFNCFGPGWISDIAEERYTGPHTFVDFRRYTDKRQLLPFGVGEVRLSRA